MSTYGIQTFKNGKGIITPDGAGGVFAGLVTFSNTDSTSRVTFTDLDGMNIYPILISGGYHNWVKGIDGNGHPYIEAPGYPIPTWRTWPAGTFNTVLGVFAK